jgi:ABC-type molybdenum transport system ATPase subunit/photorepair protein PhrA
LLRQFGLARNPFNDRTAEKTGPLDDVSLFVPSDLRDFQPSNTTYVIFGCRGAGKTTIRLMMQRAYIEENAALRAAGRSRGHFIADLSKPGHLTARLRTFQASIGATDDDWNASFSENWTTADLVDSISSFVATSLATEMSDPSS